MSILQRQKGPTRSTFMNDKHSGRRTSKRILILNTALAWGLAFYSLYTNQGSAAVASSIALIGALYGSYVGVGHLDYRRVLTFFSNTEEQQSFNYDVITTELETGSNNSFHDTPCSTSNSPSTESRNNPTTETGSERPD